MEAPCFWRRDMGSPLFLARWHRWMVPGPAAQPPQQVGAGHSAHPHGPKVMSAMKESQPQPAL